MGFGFVCQLKLCSHHVENLPYALILAALVSTWAAQTTPLAATQRAPGRILPGQTTQAWLPGGLPSAAFNLFIPSVSELQSAQSQGNFLTAALRGLVYSAETGKGVPHARVLVGGDAETSYTTDERGVFVIPRRPGQYDVYVAASGYQTRNYPTRMPDNTAIVLHAGHHTKEGSSQ